MHVCTLCVQVCVFVCMDGSDRRAALHCCRGTTACVVSLGPFGWVVPRQNFTCVYVGVLDYVRGRMDGSWQRTVALKPLRSSGGRFCP